MLLVISAAVRLLPTALLLKQLIYWTFLQLFLAN